MLVWRGSGPECRAEPRVRSSLLLSDQRVHGEREPAWGGIPRTTSPAARSAKSHFGAPEPCEVQPAIDRLHGSGNDVVGQSICGMDAFDVWCLTRSAFNRESHGNQPNSASRMLETARDLIGARVALDGEEALPRAVQDREPDPAAVRANCAATRTCYGIRNA